MNHEQTKPELDFRRIEAGDNAVVAEIIRTVMTEFKAVGCGFSINDAEVDDMFTAYAPDHSAFYVVSLDDQILGCAGIAPLKGAEQTVCELRKMYFKTELRGLGAGASLLKLCLDEARNLGYQHCYLETMEGMAQARILYSRHGFKTLDKPMGNTGHSSCETWMAREL